MTSDVQESAETKPTRPRDMSTRIFLGFLGFIAVLYGIVLCDNGQGLVQVLKGERAQ